MAWIFNRRGTYEARWMMNGKRYRKGTGIKAAGGRGISAKQAAKLAQQAADAMEAAAKGETPLTRAMDALRAVAEAQGVCDNMPSVREYLASIEARKKDRSQGNRARSHALFLQFLGDGADTRLDTITPQVCRKFIQWAAQGGNIARSTVKQYRIYISAAFNQAVNVDDILTKNPMHSVNVREEYAAAAGTNAAPSTKREPFTPAEIHRLIAEAPAPWCDMVAVSWYCIGLRLSDVCMMKWDAVDMRAGVIYIDKEIKTEQPRALAIPAPLRARLLAIRAAQDAAGERSGYIFPAMAAQYAVNHSATISTRFTSILRAMGIISDTLGEAKSGRRHRMSSKSFHSIRHSAITVLRNNPAFTPDMVRDAAGHKSEQVERGYYTATMAQRARLADALADAVESPAAPSAGIPAYPATA